jgi:multiple sugar transport system ATP-binding protein
VTAIRLDRVSKRFSRGPAALKNLSLEVRSGELFVLLGPSGSGKTTLLRLIAGLDFPTTGRVGLGDQWVERWPSSQRRIAMVFQEPTLYPHRTVEQLLLPSVRGWVAAPWSEVKTAFQKWLSWFTKRSFARREVVEDLVRAKLKVLGLQPLLNRKPHQLSGGERQRVALGRAIVRDPAAFLLDEPFSSLDIATRWALRRDLLGIQRDLGMTTVLVTHDQSEAFALADRIGVLVRGELLQVGKPAEVYRRPEHLEVARATGDPPMNVWPAIAVPREGGWLVKSSWWNGVWWNGDWNGDWGVAEEATGQHAMQDPAEIRVWIGIRPEALRVSFDSQPSSRGSAFTGWASGVVREQRLLGNRWVVELDALPGVLSSSDDSGGETMTWVQGVAGVDWGGLDCGTTVQLSGDAEDMHLFDGESGSRIMKAGRS